MLDDPGRIPNVLAHGKYYRDPHGTHGGIAVVHSNGDMVFLRPESDGATIVTAYNSERKASVFKHRKDAIENRETLEGERE